MSVSNSYAVVHVFCNVNQDGGQLQTIYSLFSCQVSVEVMTLYSDDNETTQADCGENVKAKLKGVEEEVVIKLPMLSTFVFASPTLYQLRPIVRAIKDLVYTFYLKCFMVSAPT